MTSELVLYTGEDKPAGRWARVRYDLVHARQLLLGVVLPALGFLAVPAAPILAAVLGVPALAVGILAAVELAGYGCFVAWRAER